jgi:hypothetical protein
MSSLVAVLVRLANKIGNFRRRSRRLTLDIERKTERFDQDEHKQTSLNLHIGFGNEGDDECHEPELTEESDLTISSKRF